MIDFSTESASIRSLACLHGIHTLSVTHYAYVTNLISSFVASFSEMSTGTWESRLQDALGPGGYKNSMKRSLQTVILYEAVSSSPGTGVSHPSSICIVTSLTTDYWPLTTDVSTESMHHSRVTYLETFPTQNSIHQYGECLGGLFERAHWRIKRQKSSGARGPARNPWTPKLPGRGASCSTRNLRTFETPLRHSSFLIARTTRPWIV